MSSTSGLVSSITSTSPATARAWSGPPDAARTNARGCAADGVPAADLGSLIEDAAVAVAVPVTPWAGQRQAALAAHATQVTLFGGTDLASTAATGFALSNGFGQPLLDQEYFRVLAGDPVPAGPGGAPASDVFAGLADSLSVVTGVVAGAATVSSAGSSPGVS